jgi:ribosomal subunit interface protein
MSLRVSGKNINIGEALRAHVTQRLETAAAKYFDGRVSGHVTISPEGSGFRADCSLHLASGIVLQADGRAQEPYASFDQAAERIEKRLRRYKSRLKSHHEHGHGDGAQAEVVAYHVLEAPDQENEASAEFSRDHRRIHHQLRRYRFRRRCSTDLTGARRGSGTPPLAAECRPARRRAYGWIDTPNPAMR